MKIKISNYNGVHRIVSIALDDRTVEDLKNEKVDFWYVTSDRIIEYPSKHIINDQYVSDQLRRFNNYDVIEISDNGTITRCYDDSSIDNVFFITEKCNSNCIMCPSPEHSRRYGITSNINDLITIANHMPSDTPHITITGGEPFMIGKKIFELLTYCKEKFENTEFLILTNGRVFAISEYCLLLKDSLPNNTIIGIPIHGSNSNLHDTITQTPDSFRQTYTGLSRLQKLGISFEIRIVVSKENITDLENIANLIINDFHNVSFVRIMAMEMTGNAFFNRNRLWIPYKDSFEFVKPALLTLIESGIDVRLYNYPLCTVDKEFRVLCAKSISSYKICYSSICDNCKEKKSCGGVFAGTYNLEKSELKAL